MIILKYILTSNTIKNTPWILKASTWLEVGWTRDWKEYLKTTNEKRQVYDFSGYQKLYFFRYLNSIRGTIICKNTMYVLLFLFELDERHKLTFLKIAFLKLSEPVNSSISIFLETKPYLESTYLSCILAAIIALHFYFYNIFVFLMMSRFKIFSKNLDSSHIEYCFL